MISYKIVRGNTCIDLELTVEAMLRDGWKPLGGIAFDDSLGRYMQAMIKDEKLKGNKK